MQYNIRLRQEDISYSEFIRLLKGIMPETPLRENSRGEISKK